VAISVSRARRAIKTSPSRQWSGPGKKRARATIGDASFSCREPSAGTSCSAVGGSVPEGRKGDRSALEPLSHSLAQHAYQEWCNRQARLPKRNTRITPHETGRNPWCRAMNNSGLSNPSPLGESRVRRKGVHPNGREHAKICRFMQADAERATQDDAQWKSGSIRPKARVGRGVSRQFKGRIAVPWTLEPLTVSSTRGTHDISGRRCRSWCRCAGVRCRAGNRVPPGLAGQPVARPESAKGVGDNWIRMLPRPSRTPSVAPPNADLRATRRRL
jgi:hypothetical protein